MHTTLTSVARFSASVVTILALFAGLGRLAAPQLPVGAGIQVPEGVQAAAEPAARGDFPRDSDLLIQDAELVNGPSDSGFDIASFIEAHRDALPPDPDLAALIDLTSLQHSLSPRLLLVLLSVVPTPRERTTETQLLQMAAWLADGYYGLKYRGERTLQFKDGTTRIAGVQAGAGHFAVSRLLARSGSPTDWGDLRQRFAARYEAWFGPAPWQASPLPAGLRQPPLLLPWSADQTWYFTGGPHGAWGVASAWGAVDFAPPSRVGCDVAPEWILAAAPGQVVHAADGLVLQDLDGDGDPRTGWVLVYLHVATRDSVAPGTVLAAGTPIGHPSCEGGVSDGAHVHLARRYNGEWLPAAGGPAPLALSGWQFGSLGGEYDGSMTHPALGERMAVTSRRGGDSAVVSDNGRERQAELATQWRSGNVMDAVPQASEREGASTFVAQSTAIAPSSVGQAAEGLPPTDPDTSGPRLRFRLALAGRRSATTQITVRVAQHGQKFDDLSSEVDEAGLSEPIALPQGVSGAIDIEVIAVGFLPLSALGVVVGESLTMVDLSAGGQIKAQPGDIDGDTRISGADLSAWWAARQSGTVAADLTGDGRTDIRDLWQVVGSLAGR